MKPTSQHVLYVIAAAVLLLVGFQDAAFAQTNNPIGQWTWTVYNDNSPTMAMGGTQTLCFRSDNTWFGTFSGWRGNWFQKGLNAGGNGNRVRLAGNFAIPFGGTGVGNDSAELEFVNSNFMTGYWNEWLDLDLDGTGLIFYLRITAARDATVCTITPVPPATAQAGENEQLMPFDFPEQGGTHYGNLTASLRRSAGAREGRPSPPAPRSELCRCDKS